MEIIFKDARNTLHVFSNTTKHNLLWYASVWNKNNINLLVFLESKFLPYCIIPFKWELKISIIHCPKICFGYVYGLLIFFFTRLAYAFFGQRIFWGNFAFQHYQRQAMHWPSSGLRTNSSTTNKCMTCLSKKLHISRIYSWHCRKRQVLPPPMLPSSNAHLYNKLSNEM